MNLTRLISFHFTPSALPWCVFTLIAKTIVHGREEKREIPWEISSKLIYIYRNYLSTFSVNLFHIGMGCTVQYIQ